MLRDFGYRNVMLTASIAVMMLTVSAVNGQDLGSSSGIFRAPGATSPKTASKPKTPTPNKPKTSNPNTVSKTAKPKTTVASRKPTPKTTAKTKTTPVTTDDSRTSNGEFRPRMTSGTQEIPSNVVITVGQTTAGADEQYEASIEAGNRARDDRDYPKAEADYRRANELKPRDSRAVYGLGNIFADQQRWEEAERFYRQAIMLDPDSAGPYIALSYVLTQPIVGSNVSERYAEAEKTARRAIQLDQRNAFAHDQLGVALELTGIISDETQNAYRRAIEIDPQFALAYAHLGRLMRRNGKVAESTEAYRKAIQLATDVPTIILVADVMQSQQRFAESEQLLRRALTVDERNPTALYMLGRALITRGEFGEAEQVLRKSVEVSPNSFVSYVLLSSVYLRRARLDDAEKTLGRALEVVSASERKRLAPEFEAVGDAFMKAGRAADAQRLYRQAMALDGAKTILTQKISNLR